MLSLSNILQDKRRQPGLLLALLMPLLLFGCATGTSRKDGADTFAQRSAVPIPHIPPSEAALHNVKLAIQFDWWRLLRSSTLNTLLERGFAAHPTVDSAQAALLEMQQGTLAHSGYFQHRIDVKTLTSIPEAPAANPEEAKFIGSAYYNLPVWQLETGYLPEAFRPGPAATVHTARELQNLQLEATYRTLAGNIIACALQEASLRAEIPAMRKIAAIDQNLLAIARKQLKANLVSQSVAAERQRAAEYSERSLLLLKQQFEQTRARLHLLLGIPPERDLPETLNLGELHLAELPPQDMLVSIGQRPDVRAAQLQPGLGNLAIANLALQEITKTSRATYHAGNAFDAAIASRQHHLAILERIKADFAANPASYQNRLLAERNVQLAELQLAQTHAKHIGTVAGLYHALGGAWWDMGDTVALKVSGKLKPR